MNSKTSPLVLFGAQSGRPLPLPSLSRSDRDFMPEGGYWRGSVWMPTSYMVIKAPFDET